MGRAWLCSAASTSLLVEHGGAAGEDGLCMNKAGVGENSMRWHAFSYNRVNKRMWFRGNMVMRFICNAVPV